MIMKFYSTFYINYRVNMLDVWRRSASLLFFISASLTLGLCLGILTKKSNLKDGIVTLVVRSKIHPVTWVNLSSLTSPIST